MGKIQIMLLFFIFFVKMVGVINDGGDIMANMKNAKKAIKVIEKRRNENNNYAASMKTAIKNVEKAVEAKDKEKATKALATATKRIDKALSAGVTTKNFSARNKSRLTKKVNAM